MMTVHCIKDKKDSKEKREFKVVIFDLDGTLIDSEPNYFEAFKKILEDHGVTDYTAKMNRQYYGMGVKEVLEAIKAKYHIQVPIDLLMEKSNEYYLDFAKRNTVVFPEMFKLVKKLKVSCYPLALASGSSPEIIEDILAAARIGDYFDLIISSERVGKSKPEPDVFLETARRLAVEPEHCLVLEDSPYGVMAAQRAGMSCIAVPSGNLSALHDCFFKTDLLLQNGMSDFSADKTFEWIQSDGLAV